MRVTVSTGSRLHIGFTNLGEDAGRCYGSIGVALDRPKTSIVVRPHSSLRVVGEGQEQIHKYVRLFCDRFDVEPLVSLEVLDRIWEHKGLGSGTQLSLAVGAGLAAALGIRTTVPELAGAMCRGRRSGIGIAAFQTGGLIIDAGRKKGRDVSVEAPTVVFRRDFPAKWRFVIAIPGAGGGLNGSGEEGAFKVLSPRARVSEDICRLTQLKLMPALVEEDIEEFGDALTAIDRKTGLFFAGVQGGTYGHDGVAGVIDGMLSAGAYGAGQSSWGPAVYGLVDRGRAERVENEVRALMLERGLGEQVFVTRARNHGAKVVTEPEEL